ncbi:MAG: response regulator transcription factor [Bacillota bacterium]
MYRVLIVDDEENIVNMLKYVIEKEGYTVDTAYDGYEATTKINTFNPDIILLDIMMPNKDGYQICKEFSGKYNIILLTAKSDITDKIAGIELGADDYITKPFDIREVIIRIKALLRRKVRSKPETLTLNQLTILSDHRRVMHEGREVELTPIEYNLLYLMISNLNRVFTREELLDRVWGYEYAGETRSVDIHIQRLRRKLGDFSKNIKSIYGIGYKITGDSTNED